MSGLCVVVVVPPCRPHVFMRGCGVAAIASAHKYRAVVAIFAICRHCAICRCVTVYVGIGLFVCRCDRHRKCRCVTVMQCGVDYGMLYCGYVVDGDAVCVYRVFGMCVCYSNACRERRILGDFFNHSYSLGFVCDT